MGNIITGYPPVEVSITNPNVNRDYALDKNTPFTFLEFIKNVNDSYQPDTLQEYYNDYLRKWNNSTANKTLSDNELIIERYKEFLQDIALIYCTSAERKFLSQIDFDDKNDLGIAIPFYSEKIREIIKERIKEDGYFNHYEYERPIGSPYAKN